MAVTLGAHFPVHPAGAQELPRPWLDYGQTVLDTFPLATLLKQDLLGYRSKIARYHADIRYRDTRIQPPVTRCHPELGDVDCFNGDYDCHWLRSCFKEVTRERLEVLRLVDRIDERLQRDERVPVEFDEWVISLRVLFLMGLDRFHEARGVLATCTGRPWFCAAMRGVLEGRQGDPSAARRHLDEALATMSAERRCHWLDATVFWSSSKEPPAAPFCGQPEEERLWIMADPLYITPENERLTEHLLRQAEAIPHAHVKWTERGPVEPHALTHHLTILRRGWPVGWHFELGMGAYHMVLDYENGQRFMPTQEQFEQRQDLIAADWAPGHTPWTDVFRFPGGTIRSIGAQGGVFRRQGRDHLALAARSISLAEPCEFAAALVQDGGIPRIFPLASDGFAASGLLPVSSGPLIAGVEGARTGGGYCRARFARPALPLGNASMASDVVMLREPPPADAILPLDTIPLVMLPSDTVGDDRLNLYWELYPVDVDSAEIRLEIESQETPGVVKRIWQFAFGSGTSSRSVQWKVDLSGRDIAPWTASVATSNLNEGIHQLRLVARLGEDELAVSRRFVVHRR
ncbi:MAG: hypothetical protein WD645_05590 [Dehalococcoidia bacterium]